MWGSESARSAESDCKVFGEEDAETWFGISGVDLHICPLSMRRHPGTEVEVNSLYNKRRLEGQNGQGCSEN